jgi:septal ring factor EnvC (AmiA/AmiB activator)
MNTKHWFTWVCVAVLIISEIMLFRANHARDDALADVHDARQQLQQAQSDLAAYTNSSSGQQAALVNYLKTQNASLTAQVASLTKTVNKLQTESQQTAQHLTTARDALALQQEHLQQLQAQQQQAAEIANANACLSNLRMIEAAKDQWALEKQKSATDVPTVQDLLPYLPNQALPVCPDGGTYSLNAAGEHPSCSVPGHVLPPQ